MFRKTISILLLAFVVGVHSGAIIAAPSAAIISARNELAEDAHETDSDPNYHFEYAVNDETTGDHKSQFETRQGDVVNGRYTVLEPTGETRQVDYTADAINGFNAVVTRHAPAKFIAQPAIVAAPTKLIAQPAYVAAPAKIIAQPTYVAAAAPAKLVAAKYISQPIVAAAPASYIAHQPFAKYAYSAPIVSHAPYVAQYHAPSAAIVSHSPYIAQYAAPAAAIIHH